MTTRHKESGGPLSQNRYMSSPEFSELRAINGVATAARAAILANNAKRDFIWWLQAQSLNDGGLRRLAKELLEAFPDRLGTSKMIATGIDPENIYDGNFVRRQEGRLLGRNYLAREFEESKPKSGNYLIELCRACALAGDKGSDSLYWGLENFSLEQFMLELCVNPRVLFSAPNEECESTASDEAAAIEEDPEIKVFKHAAVKYFHDVVGALFKLKAQQESRIRENFYLTEIGKKIWETLDYALNRRRMVVIDGLEGRGKTEALKAWCALHLGRARFVSLKGITSKTTAFREIARTLGIASSYTRTAPEMQARIEDVLKRSGLMLVIDEAHFVFSQSRRVSSRPELVDWIDTAICNRDLPIALATTPQFLVCMTRAADQVEWNYKQFRRRVKRWIRLPDRNSENDIKGVAQNVFKTANQKVLSLVAGYALLSKRDLSAVGDVADEVRALLGSEDLKRATERHVHQAIHEYLVPSDKSFLEGMENARNMKPRRGRKSVVAPATAPEPIAPEQKLESPQRMNSDDSLRPQSPIASRAGMTEFTPA